MRMVRKSLAILAVCSVVALVVLLAYRKLQPSRGTSSNPLDRINASPTKPVHFLHKTFTVRNFAKFAIEVPPHSVIPRIHGNFRSFVQQPGDDDLSDDSTDVGFLLMNPSQFAEYSRAPAASTALYTVEATHAHEVEFVLPPTRDEPAKYYVVFFNAPGGAAVKSVTADFQLSFGY